MVFHPLNSFFLLRRDLDVVHAPCIGHAPRHAPGPAPTARLPRLLDRLVQHLDELLLMAADLL